VTTRILVVDDDVSVRDTIQRYLALHGFEVETAADGVQAGKTLERSPVDLVITDIIMPELDGFSLIGDIRAYHPDVRVIAISGGGLNASASYLAAAKRLGAHAALSKPVTFPELLACIQQLLQKAAP